MISTVYSGILILLNARWDKGHGQVRGGSGGMKRDVQPGFCGGFAKFFPKKGDLPGIKHKECLLRYFLRLIQLFLI